VNRSVGQQRLLDTLRGLKWKDLIAPGAENPAGYGLDKPAVELRFFRARQAPKSADEFKGSLPRASGADRESRV
jgi:hypothetical protein